MRQVLQETPLPRSTRPAKVILRARCLSLKVILCDTNPNSDENTETDRRTAVKLDLNLWKSIELHPWTDWALKKFMVKVSISHPYPSKTKLECETITQFKKVYTIRMNAILPNQLITITIILLITTIEIPRRSYQNAFRLRQPNFQLIISMLQGKTPDKPPSSKVIHQIISLVQVETNRWRLFISTYLQIHLWQRSILGFIFRIQLIKEFMHTEINPNHIIKIKYREICLQIKFKKLRNWTFKMRPMIFINSIQDNQMKKKLPKVPTRKKHSTIT